MQITNNNTTVELDEQRLLDLIMDGKIDKLERVVKQYYEVTKISDLSAEAKNILMYLCIVALDKKAVEIAEVYDVTISEIVEGTKKVFAKTAENKKFRLLVYSLYISYKQQLRGVQLTKSVA